MSDKPSRNEEEYFAKREAELLKARRETAERAVAEAARQAHYRKCPRCGADLRTEDYQGVQVDRCPEDRGIWLDAGEIDALSRREDAGIIRILKSVIRGVSGA